MINFFLRIWFIYMTNNDNSLIYTSSKKKKINKNIFIIKISMKSQYIDQWYILFNEERNIIYKHIIIQIWFNTYYMK